MKKLICIFFYFLSISQTNAQTTIAENITDFSLDGLGNCYALNDHEILKLSKGQLTSKNSIRKNGVPFSIDAVNPMNIVVLFRDFGTISTYDNFLGSKPNIYLKDWGMIDPALFAVAYDQGIWMFDDATQLLNKIDLNSTTISTVDLKQILFEQIHPTKIAVSNNWLVLATKTKILIFDQFGTYIKTFNIDDAPVLLQIIENTLWMNKGEQVFTIDLKHPISYQQEAMTIPAKSKKIILDEIGYWTLYLDGRLIKNEKK